VCGAVVGVRAMCGAGPATYVRASVRAVLGPRTT
jgi:hypothetical protein